HFISRKAMNIDGLGNETVESLFRRGLLEHISDLYTLYDKTDALRQQERFGEKSISNMLEGIERSKQQPFEKVLFGLGIRYVGETVARKLAAHFKNIDSLMSASYDELVSVEEIGSRIAESLIEFFKDPRHLVQIEKLRNAGLQFQAEEHEVELQSDRLSGKTFIISGVFERFSRDELKDIIEANGGKIVSSISTKLNYLVAGDNMGPSKLEKANKLNIPIISDTDLLNMID
ncbi:MAG TPA: helix-hairpin-helix domain-containing protein, partial [Sphingobacteriaceae bacterium]